MVSEALGVPLGDVKDEDRDQGRCKVKQEQQPPPPPPGPPPPLASQAPAVRGTLQQPPPRPRPQAQAAASPAAPVATSASAASSQRDGLSEARDETRAPAPSGDGLSEVKHTREQKRCRRQREPEAVKVVLRELGVSCDPPPKNSIWARLFVADNLRIIHFKDVGQHMPLAERFAKK